MLLALMPPMLSICANRNILVSLGASVLPICNHGGAFPAAAFGGMAEVGAAHGGGRAMGVLCK